jgi:hypothetical protein
VTLILVAFMIMVKLYDIGKKIRTRRAEKHEST